MAEELPKASSGKQPGEDGTRRASKMSVEGPGSPTSDSGDSISDSSSDRFNHDVPEKTLTPIRSTATTGSTNDLAFEVDFEEDESGNPRHWPLWAKCVILGVMSYATTIVGLFSISYASAIPGEVLEFGISDQTGILGVTTYMIGIAVGSIILAPISEMHGRRPVYVVALALFVIFVIPCALAKNIESILIPRFFGAFCAAAMISNTPGTVNDIVEEEYRALAYSIWSIGPMNGPVIGSVVGEFTYQYLGWRWTNWVVVIAGAVGWIVVSAVPETYAPALLRARSAKKRKETGDSRYWSRYDEKKEFLPMLKINMSRPFVLAVTEPICVFWNLYMALVYGVLYLCFVAYPIVFQGLRGWTPGLSGLAFTGIGVGSMIVILGEPLIRKWINSHKIDPATGNVSPEAMVSVVCVAAILIPVGELWFAWTSTPNVHWILPILAGIPFGMGNSAVFIYASNYLIHSYEIYAASALAGNAVLRSILGACLPLAGPGLYTKLGAHWAGTLLALLEFACVPIPFIFYRYGYKIRQKSALIRSMREDKERADSKRARAEARIVQRAEAEATALGAAGLASGVGAMDEAYDEERGLERDLEKGAAVHSVVHRGKEIK